MHLLLASATEFEISDTVRWIDTHRTGLFTVKPKLLITGIGQLQTTYSLQNRIRLQKPDLIIQAGIGGASSASDLGEIFALQSDRIADLGLADKNGFHDIFEMGLDQADRPPFQRGLLPNPYSDLLTWSGLPLREGITVNEIKAADALAFQRNPRPVVESMEGAALHYVGLMEGIPFLQIRAVSNELGERDKTKWQIAYCLKKLHETLVLLIQKLEKTDETLFRLQPLSK